MEKETSSLFVQRSHDSKRSLEVEEVSANNAILCPAMMDAIMPHPT